MDDPAVTIALVSGVSMGVIPAAIAAWQATRAAQRVGNGPRSTNGLLHELIASQAGQDKRLARLERDMADIRTTINGRD